MLHAHFAHVLKILDAEQYLDRIYQGSIAKKSSKNRYWLHCGPVRIPDFLFLISPTHDIPVVYEIRNAPVTSVYVVVEPRFFLYLGSDRIVTLQQGKCVLVKVCFEVNIKRLRNNTAWSPINTISRFDGSLQHEPHSCPSTSDPNSYNNSCDLQCMLTVLAAICGVSVVIAVAVVVRCVRKKTKTEKRCTKTVDRSVSLSALPSDYVDHENERSRMSPNASMTSLEWSPHFVFPKIPVSKYGIQMKKI